VSLYSNPAARSWVSPRAGTDTRAFHRTLPGYAPTRLVELPSIAAELGVGRVFAKEESGRLGMPAFKILGASHAIVRALGGTTLDDVPPTSRTIVAATDGNHGRAVAHMAALLGVTARIFVPDTITVAAREAIAAEGAELTVLATHYDDVVQYARREAEATGALLVQDSAWPGYEQIPGWITDGYSTLFAEIDEQLAEAGAGPASLVTAPTGVGALAEAAVHHHRVGAPDAAVVLVVEPDTAACVLASLQAGTPVAVATGHTAMNGLNCGVVSPGAWAPMRDGVDAAVAVSDTEAIRATRDLQALGVDAGPCGASSLAAVRAVPREQLGLGSDAVLVLLVTEGMAANPLAD